MTRHPHRRPTGIRLSPGHRAWLLASVGALLATGMLWLAYHYMLPRSGESDPGSDPLEAWWLRLHGAAAMLFLVVFGSLLPIHVQGAWRERRNRPTGTVLFSTVALLVASGYGLYYAGDDWLRSWVSAAHWGVGIAAAPALAVHVIIGRRRRARAGRSDPGKG